MKRKRLLFSLLVIAILALTIFFTRQINIFPLNQAPNSGESEEEPPSEPWVTINSSVYYVVRGDKLYMVNTSTGKSKPIYLFGVNWFGFETTNYVVHGLWARNWIDMLQQIKSLGFNAIRLPFCTKTIDNSTTPTSINYDLNPDLEGLSSLKIMKKIVIKASELGIYVLLDYHRIGCQYIEPLWYNETFTEKDYINTWVKVAKIFGKYWNVIGADLKNEPHSISGGDEAYYDNKSATWGMNNNKTDWNLAAERIGKAILKIAPHWLIFVEGTQFTNPKTDNSYKWGRATWWGGNLMAVKDYPVNLSREKLVYAPHVYGPDVYQQPYFSGPNFPENMDDIWYHHFGYVKSELGYPIAIGEFGGKYGHDGHPKDVEWQNAFVDWLIKNDICYFFYWSWNPNSGDTGGLLKDDWTTIWEDKYNNLRRLMNHCIAKFSANPTAQHDYFFISNTKSSSNSNRLPARFMKDNPLERRDSYKAFTSESEDTKRKALPLSLKCEGNSSMNLMETSTPFSPPIKSNLSSSRK